MNIIPKAYINWIKYNLQFIIVCLVLIMALSFLYQIFSNNIIEGMDQIKIQFKSSKFNPIYIIPNNSSQEITNLFTNTNPYTLSKNSNNTYNLVINESLTKPFIVSTYGDSIMNCFIYLAESSSQPIVSTTISDLVVSYDSYNKSDNGSFGKIKIKYTSNGINPTMQSNIDFTIYVLDNTIDKQLISSIQKIHNYDMTTITGIIASYSKENTDINNLTIYKKDNSVTDILKNIDTSTFIPLISQYFISNGYLQKDNNKIHSVYFTDNPITPLFMYNQSSFINNRFISGYIQDSSNYPCILEIIQ